MIGGFPIPYMFIVFSMLFFWGMATTDKTLMAISLICALLGAYQASLSPDKSMDRRRNHLAGYTGLLTLVGLLKALLPVLF